MLSNRELLQVAVGLFIAKRGDAWAVLGGTEEVVHLDLDGEFEASPSCRTMEFKSRTGFVLDEAVNIAVRFQAKPQQVQ